MTAYESETSPRRPAVDGARLWTGGAATALVAALLTVVGILLARGLFGVPVLAPKGAGTWGDASTGWYALGAAVASLAATGFVHALLLFTPRPMLFFGWVIALATATAVLAPFTTDQSTAPKVATAVLNLMLGIAIGSLVAGSARSAVQTAARRAAPDRYR
ncbi:MAG: hypothetical protein AUI14_08795 [Actinobacteria bacterium 13_2_20CM_2_71_6]|nr:MAG: hypothetical protein AUI14_08795 [Actinobacteria bacterium 13_2_20CM_2_71_6]